MSMTNQQLHLIPLPYGITAVIFLKKIAVRKCSTLKIDFSANFNMIFFGGGSVNTPKIGKRKNNVTNINLRECKTKKKHEGGVCYGQNGS